MHTLICSFARQLMHCVGCYLSYARHATPYNVIHVLAPGDGHATISEFALKFEDVTCFEQYKIWHVYNVNC